jgi:hypothetical protein
MMRPRVLAKTKGPFEDGGPGHGSASKATILWP